jgi:hypothetical protein
MGYMDVRIENIFSIKPYQIPVLEMLQFQTELLLESLKQAGKKIVLN